MLIHDATDCLGPAMNSGLGFSRHAVSSPSGQLLFHFGADGLPARISSGCSGTRAVRARGDRGVKLVAASGYAQPEDVQRALEAGFDVHMAKPPVPELLEGLIAAGPGRE